jgi:exonuclease SbcC
MLIDSVRIAAFRGIRNEIDLDFTAPVTLLHAPNGTGKTSVCDSCEWLLTGQVTRLAEALPDSPDGGVRNYAAGDLETYVRVKLKLADVDYDLRRTITGNVTRLERFQSQWRAFTQDALLAAFTPSDLPKRTTHQRNVNRAVWLRSVRLLEAPNLNLLLDDTAGGKGVRDLLFANLFGVGELQERQEKLEKLLKEMTPPRTIQNGSQRLRSDIQQITTALDQAATRASVPFQQVARQSILKVAEFLNAPSPEDLPLAQGMAQLQDLLRSQRQSHDRARSALSAVAGRWDSFQALVAEMTRLEAEKKVAIAQFNAHRVTLGECEREVAKANQVVNVCVRLEDKVRDIAFDLLQSELSSALAEYLKTGGNAEQTLGSSTVQADGQRLTSRRIEYNRRKRLISSCAEKLPRWLQARADLQSAQSRSASLVVPSPRDVTANDRALSEVEAELTKINAETARLSAPLQRLRTEGKRIAESLPNEHHCPLCAHDFGSAQRLLAAIEIGLNALPEALSVLARQKVAVETRAQEMREQKRLWTAATTEKSQVERSIVSNREVFQSASEELRLIGAESLNPNDAGFVEDFRRFQTVFEQSEIALAKDEMRTSALVRESDRLKRVLTDVTEAAGLLAPLSRRPVSRDAGLAALPLSQWVREVERLASERTQVMPALVESTAAARRELSSRGQRLEAAQVQVVNADVLRQSFDTRLGVLRPSILEVKDQWAVAASERELSHAALDAVNSDLGRAAERLAQAEAEIQIAAENLTRAEEASNREQQRQVQRDKLAELNLSLQRLDRISARRKIIADAITTLRNAKDSFLKSQVEPLCEVISSLYLRAQSNPFIKKVGTDQQDGHHRWILSTEGFSLEAVAQLSQGQRQDLALAVFLSRARSLRGTFFLDEPLLHLDDLNRVALLDVLRVMIVEQGTAPLRLIITTASNALVRHFRDKFASVAEIDGCKALRIYLLSGNPLTEVQAFEE